MTFDPRETCWTVLRAAVDGDSVAQSTFTRLYAAVIGGFLRARWRGRALSADVDDAAQEVFVECFKPGGVLERADADAGQFRGLLYGVVRNVARRFETHAVERGRVRPEESTWVAQVAADDAGQATMFEQSWARGVMKEAMAMLRQRAAGADDRARRRVELLERRFADDQPIRDIAAAWDVPAREVHNDYRKARVEFYACLQEVVRFHSRSADVDAECRRLVTSLSPAGGGPEAL